MSTMQSYSKYSPREPAAKPPFLTRLFLDTDGTTARPGKDGSGVRLLTEAERSASLISLMETRPPEDVWIFAYGSLIWNPAFKFVEQRVAQIHGWHRSFCLSMPLGRGAPDQPGLALGLDRGGVCQGVAYRIAAKDITSELSVLWGREMLIGGYKPIWIDVTDDVGDRFGSAIAFTIDRSHEHYAGNLSRHEKVRRLASARGGWGSSAEYLYRTIISLREHDIQDGEMGRLGDLVKATGLGEWDEAA